MPEATTNFPECAAELRKWQARTGISFAELSRIISKRKYYLINGDTLASIARGARQPTADQIRSISKAINISADRLMGLNKSRIIDHILDNDENDMAYWSFHNLQSILGTARTNSALLAFINSLAILLTEKVVKVNHSVDLDAVQLLKNIFFEQNIGNIKSQPQRKTLQAASKKETTKSASRKQSKSNTKIRKFSAKKKSVPSNRS